jgi:ABC-type sugar transport system ATPase subunit
VSSSWRAILDQQFPTGGEVIMGFRPEAVELTDDSGQIAARVYADDFHGGYAMLHLELARDEIIHARATRLVDYNIGTPLQFNLKPEMVRFFNPQTEKALPKPSGGVQ